MGYDRQNKSRQQPQTLFEILGFKARGFADTAGCSEVYVYNEH